MIVDSSFYIIYKIYIYNNVHTRTHYIYRARQKFRNGKYYVIVYHR